MNRVSYLCSPQDLTLWKAHIGLLLFRDSRHVTKALILTTYLRRLEIIPIDSNWNGALAYISFRMTCFERPTHINLNSAAGDGLG